MTKNDVRELFGNVTKACDAMGIKSRKTFYSWPDPLTQAQTDRVIGAYSRIAEDRDKLLVHSIGGKK